MRQNKSPVFVLAISLALLLSAGCESGSNYTLKVDAVQNPEVEGLESYQIVSSNAEVSEEDLWFKETGKYVKTALSGKGLYEAPDLESADMIVDIAYGVSELRITFETHSEPIEVEWGGGMKEITIMVNDASGGQYPTQRQVYEPPQREIVGYEDRVGPVRKYKKYLRVTARVNQSEEADESPVQAWSVYVTSEDESDDLRKYLPVLTAASIRYVGKSTDKQEEIELKGKDEIVAFVKAGM